MTKYDHTDFMPKDDSFNDAKEESSVVPEEVSEEQQIVEDDSEVVEEVATDISDPECGVVEGKVSTYTWARYISTFFLPILIPTYCMAIAMWITPLAVISENTRLGATIMVLVITALAPMTYLIAMVRLGRLRAPGSQPRIHRVVPAFVNFVCLLAAAFYLYKSMAPEWLFMMPAAGAVAVLAFFVVGFWVNLSSHTTAMGALTAFVFYLGRNNLTDLPITPWVLVIILLSGLVGSARVALGRHNPLQVGLGYTLGFAAAYLTLSLHVFNAQALPS